MQNLEAVDLSVVRLFQLLATALRAADLTSLYGSFIFSSKKLAKKTPKIKEVYTSAHTRCRQECVVERVEFGRVIAFYMLFTRAQSAADAGTSVTRTALSDSTPLT